jgi:hypothetical protein
VRSRYVFAGVFFCSAAMLIELAREGGLRYSAIVLAWFSFDLVVVGLAYLSNWKTVFGKTATGSLRIAPLVLMLPYLAVCWAVWHLQNLLSTEPIWNEVAPGIFVGRRCRLEEMPPGISKVIDFTAEFPGDRAARRTVQWLSIPVLDGCAPEPEQYQSGFAFLGEPQTSATYLYCANGHGRSATFSCALLRKRGIAATPGDAVVMVVQRRHGASLNGEQLRSLQQQELARCPGGD